jgi:hypothetical protein
MYSTCLFCNQPLGRNEAIEHFPVGRRLAYDATKGRLWVVCRECERWNLTPIEERWEAIEECERLFRDTRLRVATDNVGLAKIAEGTELVRIGQPMRPEFAAWRYGDQFGRRRRRQVIVAGGALVGVTAVVAGGMAAGASIGAFGYLLGRVVQSILQGNPGAVIARVPMPGRAMLEVKRGHLAETTLDLGGASPLSIDVRHVDGRTRFEGRDAERVAALLMPQVNRFGGTKAVVSEAVRAIERDGGPEAYLARLARVARVTTRPPGKLPKNWTWGSTLPKGGLFGLEATERIALEMALHEEAERRALGGELAELETAWRQAEEIAAIADNLLLP